MANRVLITPGAFKVSPPGVDVLTASEDQLYWSSDSKMINNILTGQFIKPSAGAGGHGFLSTSYTANISPEKTLIQAKCLANGKSFSAMGSLVLIVDTLGSWSVKLYFDTSGRLLFEWYNYYALGQFTVDYSILRIG